MHPIAEMVALSTDWKFWLKIGLGLVLFGAAVGGLIVWALV
jgi:hypothetical protein